MNVTRFDLLRGIEVGHLSVVQIIPMTYSDGTFDSFSLSLLGVRDYLDESKVPSEHL